MLRRIDEEHVIGLLTLFQYQDAHRNAGREKQVGRQANYRINVAILKQLGANALFSATAEENAVRQDDSHGTFFGEEVKAMQQEGKIGGGFRREAIAF